VALIAAENISESPPEWLVKDLIPFCGTGFVWGPSRVGKSLLVNGELALAVANGTEFFGRETAQGSVAICFGEGFYDARTRLTARLIREQEDRQEVAQRLAEAKGQDAAEAWLAGLPAYDDSAVYFRGEPFILPLDNGGEPTQSLKAAIAELKTVPNLSLVILDALSDFTPSLSISNNASANRVVSGMKFLARELGCVVLAVAHPVTSGRKMAGDGRLFNASDFVIQVQPDESVGTRIGAAATVNCEKVKYGKPFDPFGYYVDRIAWEHEYVDDDGSPTGETALAESATVRSMDPAVGAFADAPPKPKRALPRSVRADAPRRAGVR
jgi:hypothetical protein